MATATDIKGFFTGVTSKKQTRTILPVGEENGAPIGNHYLFRYTNPRTGVTSTGEYEGSPYMSFQAEVVKPDNFAGKKLRVFMGIFRKGDEENIKFNAEAIGGDSACDDLPADAGEAFETLAARLEGEEFVGRIGLGFNKKEQRDEVRIYDYLPASDWMKLQESGSGW